MATFNYDFEKDKKVKEHKNTAGYQLDGLLDASLITPGKIVKVAVKKPPVLTYSGMHQYLTDVQLSVASEIKDATGHDVPVLVHYDDDMQIESLEEHLMYLVRVKNDKRIPYWDWAEHKERIQKVTEEFLSKAFNSEVKCLVIDDDVLSLTNLSDDDLAAAGLQRVP